jgi:hypothetical protein
LDATKTNYTSYPACNCEVHKGFYDAEQRVINEVITEVKRLKGLYPTAAVKTTGHSLGAALASLTAMDLIKAGYPTSTYNFGSPRVGTAAFSSFVGTVMTDLWRVTHTRDLVPHNPGSGGLLNFWHTCREEYEDGAGNVHSCSATNCEDPTCADQWASWQLDISAHLVYLGMCMGQGCGYCLPPIN